MRRHYGLPRALKSFTNGVRQLLSSLILVVGFVACFSEDDESEPSVASRAETVSKRSMGVESIESLKLSAQISTTASSETLSAAKGHDAFYTYGCWHCHTLGDEEAPGMRNASAMGPDLADVGRRLGMEEIFQSILEPNAVIAEPR